MRFFADKFHDETRLLEDLNKIASDKGFTISENPASGNCMFYALTEQLYHAQGIDFPHENLRATLVQFLRENRTLVSQCVWSFRVFNPGVSSLKVSFQTTLQTIRLKDSSSNECMQVLSTTYFKTLGQLLVSFS